MAMPGCPVEMGASTQGIKPHLNRSKVGYGLLKTLGRRLGELIYHAGKFR